MPGVFETVYVVVGREPIFGFKPISVQRLVTDVTHSDTFLEKFSNI
jgi:hypothetical protein